MSTNLWGDPIVDLEELSPSLADRYRDSSGAVDFCRNRLAEASTKAWYKVVVGPAGLAGLALLVTAAIGVVLMADGDDDTSYGPHTGQVGTTAANPEAVTRTLRPGWESRAFEAGRQRGNQLASWGVSHENCLSDTFNYEHMFGEGLSLADVQALGGMFYSGCLSTR